MTTSPSTTPGQLVANPGSLSFGSVQVGNSQTLTAAITNTGGSSVTLSQATAGGTGFSISGLSLPMTLAVGESVTFSATFAPQSGGSASGSSFCEFQRGQLDADDGTGRLRHGTRPVDGYAGLDRFWQCNGRDQQESDGHADRQRIERAVSSVSMTSAEFSLSGITLPLTIAAGQSVPFTLTFTPQTSGSASATGSFTSNASNSAAESLTGTGAAPPQHSVDLTWNGASTVVGYNVYRGSQSGGPYTKINSALNASTTYTDSSVQAGQTYYYVTTAVDSSGAESSYSSEVQAPVPSP